MAEGQVDVLGLAGFLSGDSSTRINSLQDFFTKIGFVEGELPGHLAECVVTLDEQPQRSPQYMAALEQLKEHILFWGGPLIDKEKKMKYARAYSLLKQVDDLLNNREYMVYRGA